MADYKVVDVEKLETELTEVAEEVRILADTQEKMSINKMTENVAQANDTIELQRDIILEIKTTLEGKAGGSKEEQEKTLSITKNGNYEVLADENKTLSKVNVEANIALEGDIGKPYVDTSKIEDFSYFCYGGRRIDCLKNTDTSNGTNFSYMFQNGSSLKEIPFFDTSSGKTFSYMFSNCNSLTELPDFDTSEGQTFTNMCSSCKSLTKFPRFSFRGSCASVFQSCTGLTEIPELDLSGCDKISNFFRYCSAIKKVEKVVLPLIAFFNNDYAFAGCSSLETINLTTAIGSLGSTTFQDCFALTNITIGVGWSGNIYLHYSEKLTVESLHGMIENLADLTGQTAKTFQIGSTNLAKIDEEHLTMLQNKNWNYL